MHRVRIYHAVLAICALLAYATGELGPVHAWLGYGVAGVVVLRLLWALGGERQFGLTRFYPSFEGLDVDNALHHPAVSRSLMLGIAVSLLLATATGIALDEGDTLSSMASSMVADAHADSDSDSIHDDTRWDALEESHELFSDLMLLFVGMHLTYLLLFKRPLARFMLFLPSIRASKGHRGPID